jgi:hypothetical protein
MSSSSSSSTAVLVAGSALLVAGLSFGLMGYNSSGAGAKSRSSALVVSDIDNDEDTNSDFITASEVAKIFDRLFLEMQGVLSQLMQQIQQIQMSGQTIPEKQLQQLLRQEMERALVVKQGMIIEEFDLDMDCLEEATWEFLEKGDEYPLVKKAVERFQKLWEGATGEPVTGWRPGKAADKKIMAPILSPERTIEVAAKYFDSLTDNMKVLVSKFKAQGKDLREPPVQQMLNMEFAQTANDAGEAALEAVGVTMEQFENSVKAHGDNPTVGRALGMLQMKQQQDLMSIGADSGAQA